ncbi:unnamed protein product [Linum tenue]|uniref:RNase H type-1 domain-containing protein n=1 Tax=Linum tenue TaxID=586396 RepID=A0AAV0R2D5_9ROSI|nr:unnamed protein product [Linum tenue]
MQDGTWQHCPRTANNAADLMARSETRWNERCVWVDSPPIFLVDQLKLDAVTTLTD